MHAYDYTIHEVTHAKYLGVVIDSKLSWSEHIKQVTNRANKVKGFLQRHLYIIAQFPSRLIATNL